MSTEENPCRIWVTPAWRHLLKIADDLCLILKSSKLQSTSYPPETSKRLFFFILMKEFALAIHGGKLKIIVVCLQEHSL